MRVPSIIFDEVAVILRVIGNRIRRQNYDIFVLSEFQYHHSFRVLDNKTGATILLRIFWAPDDINIEVVDDKQSPLPAREMKSLVEEIVSGAFQRSILFKKTKTPVGGIA